ncbi:MAG: ankyrin repeat protein [Chlamydiales bacterium]|jgi:ankyrin repeat protein
MSSASTDILSNIDIVSCCIAPFLVSENFSSDNMNSYYISQRNDLLRVALTSKAFYISIRPSLDKIKKTYHDNIKIMWELKERYEGSRLSLMHSVLLLDDVSTLKVFLANCSSINASDKRGRTILHIAALLGLQKSVKIIASYPGVDFSKRTNFGKTAKELAKNELVASLIPTLLPE